MRWGDLFQIAVGQWGMAPSEFYALSPQEFWLLHEIKTPVDPKSQYAGGMSEDECDELYAMLA